MSGRFFRLASPVTLLMPMVLLLACTTSTPAPAATSAPKQSGATAAPASTRAPAPTAAIGGTEAPADTAPSSAVVAATAAPAAASSGSITLQWFGQSTFLLTSSRGTRILMDPTNASSGYTIQPMAGVDAVTVSHEHGDHNNVALATGNPTLIRGLKDGDWVSVDQAIKDVRIRSFPVFHDGQQGAQRGKNAVFLFEVDGLRVVHSGDLGHQLSQEQAAALGKVDILVIPVGGSYTVDAAGASKVVEQLSPRAVVPMHYRTAKVPARSPVGPVDPFLEGKTVEKVAGNELEMSRERLPNSTTVYILGYES